ncbi:putative NTP pyrophosphohydrolase [Edwardsiella phage vB_EpP_ZHX]|nr:putative NTP pyrophosphohydrolase [Edwardsiella phage vB_EpP_ZHX]
MNNIYQRVVTWNEARYEREFNLNLAVALLREEYNEWLTAKTKVGKLDGLCDIAFVALGVIWKNNTPDFWLDDAFQRAYDNQLAHSVYEPIYYTAALLDVLERTDVSQEQVLDIMAELIVQCQAQALYMGLSNKQWLRAMNVVCDSNASKSIKKVASDVKANAGDKGPFYFPPTSGLAKILREVKIND